MSTAVALVLTAVEGAEAARQMAQVLVAEQLAACVQIMPITSVYRWNGSIETADEHLLICKIASTAFASVEAAIRARHSYDIPEIVMLPIAAGHAPYLAWMAASLAHAT